MTWSTSEVFEYAVLQLAKKAGQNLQSDSYSVAIYFGGTPDNTVATAVLTEYNGAGSQWVAANEVPTSGSYTNGAGGISVAGDTAVAQDVGTGVIFTCSVQPVATGVTWNGANSPQGCLVFDASQANQGLSFHYFGAPAPITGGNFTIGWSSSPVAGSLVEFAC